MFNNPTSQPISFSTKLKIRVAQWNCRSLSNEKLNYINSHSAEVVLLQETWRPSVEAIDHIPLTSFIQTRENNQGGGSLISINGLAFIRNQTVPINRDFSIHRILIGRDKFLWIGSVYLSTGTPAQLKSLFKQIYDKIPSYEWKFILLAGDFNFNLRKSHPKLKLLNTLVKQFGLELKRTNLLTSLFGEPDFLIHGSALSVELVSVNAAPSDHRCLIWEVELPCPDHSTKIRIPNKSFAEEITSQAWLKTANTRGFLRYIQYARETFPNKLTVAIDRKPYRKPAIQKLLDSDEDCDAYEILRKYYNQFYKKLEDIRFSNFSREFFQCIKKCLNMITLTKEMEA